MSFEVCMLKWYINNLLDGDNRDRRDSCKVFDRCLTNPDLAERACDIVRAARDLAEYNSMVHEEIQQQLISLWEG